MEISFVNPVYLWSLLALPFLFLIHYFSYQYVNKKGIVFANFDALKRVTGGRVISWNIPLLCIRIVILLLLALSAAGTIIWYKGQSSDYNYVLALDASGSMLADDFTPNRFEAAKQAAVLFIDTLKAKAKIGVVSFSGIGFVDYRLSDDKGKLKQIILDLQMRSMHGTAIGDALQTARNMLVLEDKSRSIILLTDGRENVALTEEMNKILEDLKKNQIIVHVIGVGTEKGGMLPGIESISTIDEPFLKTITNTTGGTYFRADSNIALTNAYTSLATSTEAMIPVKLQFPFLTAAIILLFIEWALINTRFRSIP